MSTFIVLYCKVTYLWLYGFGNFIFLELYILENFIIFIILLSKGNTKKEETNVITERQKKGRELALMNSVISLEVLRKSPVVEICSWRIKVKSCIFQHLLTKWNMQVFAVIKKEASDDFTLYWITEFKDKE